MLLIGREHAGNQHPRPAVDRGQRRAQLVRHRHQELVFQAHRVFGVAPRALLGFERTGQLRVHRREPCRFELLGGGQLAFDAAPGVDLPEQNRQRGGERQAENHVEGDGAQGLAAPGGENIRAVERHRHNQVRRRRDVIGAQHDRPAGRDGALNRARRAGALRGFEHGVAACRLNGHGSR